MDLSTLKTDETLEEEGVAVMYDDAEITIRGSGYKPYEDYILKETTRHANRRIITKGGVKGARLQMKIAKQGLAKHLWVSHKNLDLEGKPLGQDEKSKLEALEYREFYLWLDEECARVENFQKEAIAEDAEAVKKVG